MIGLATAALLVLHAYAAKFETFQTPRVDRFPHSPARFTVGLSIHPSNNGIYEAVGLGGVSRIIRYPFPRKSSDKAGQFAGTPTKVNLEHYIPPNALIGSLTAIPGGIIAWDVPTGKGWIIRESIPAPELAEGELPPMTFVGQLQLPPDTIGIAAAELPYCDGDDHETRPSHDAFPYLFFVSNGSNIVRAFEVDTTISHELGKRNVEQFEAVNALTDKLATAARAAGKSEEEVEEVVRSAVVEKYNTFLNATPYLDSNWLTPVPHEDFAAYHAGHPAGGFTELEVAGSHLWALHARAPFIMHFDVRGAIRRRARGRHMETVRLAMGLRLNPPSAPPAEPRKVPIVSMQNITNLVADANASFASTREALLADEGWLESNIPDLRSVGLPCGLGAEYQHSDPAQTVKTGRGKPTGVFLTGQFWPTLYGIPPPANHLDAPYTCSNVGQRVFELGEGDEVGNWDLAKDLPVDPDAVDRLPNEYATKPKFELSVPEEVADELRAATRRSYMRRAAEIGVALILIAMGLWFYRGYKANSAAKRRSKDAAKAADADLKKRSVGWRLFGGTMIPLLSICHDIFLYF